MNNKFKLTNVSIKVMGVELFQIKAKKSFGNINKGDLGGYIEKEENLNVYGNAWVYGDARVSGEYNYIKGKFIGGDDTEKITRIEDKMGTNYWKAQYVLGDYEITPQDEEKEEIVKEYTIEQLQEKLGEEFKIIS